MFVRRGGVSRIERGISSSMGLLERASEGEVEDEGMWERKRTGAVLEAEVEGLMS